jgi:hypothetical protein
MATPVIGALDRPGLVEQTAPAPQIHMLPTSGFGPMMGKWSVTGLRRMSRTSLIFGGGHNRQAAITGHHDGRCRQFGGDVLVKSTAKSGQVQVPVHAELLACFGYPGGAPAQRHLAVLPVLHVAGVGAWDGDHRLDAVRAAQRPAEGGRTPRRSTVTVSAMTSRSYAAAPCVGALEFFAAAPASDAQSTPPQSAQRETTCGYQLEVAS